MRRHYVDFGFFLLIITGCTKDIGNLPQPKKQNAITFEEDIRPIASSHCAISGCHVGSFPFGDFNDYQALKKRVDNGKFQTLVLDLRMMPPNGVKLDTNQITTLRAWIANGSPER